MGSPFTQPTDVLVGNAAAVLLRLATRDVPDAQLSGLSAWLQQHSAISLVDVMSDGDGAASYGVLGSISQAQWLKGESAGYLCWPISVLGTRTAAPSGSSSNNTGSGNNSSSEATLAPASKASTGTAGGCVHGEALGSTGARLQVLAHAAAVMLRRLQLQLRSPSRDPEDVPERCRQEVAGLSHLLLLVVQQLQGVPAQERTSFLHSPAGGEVLRVLSELDSMEVAGWGSALAMILPTGSQEPAGAIHKQQQPSPPAAETVWLTAHALVQELLLPGLLLQPVQVQQAGAAGAGVTGSSIGVSSTDNSAAGQGSSDTSTCSSTCSSCCLAAATGNISSSGGGVNQAASSNGSSSDSSSEAVGCAATSHPTATHSSAGCAVVNFGTGERTHVDTLQVHSEIAPLSEEYVAGRCASLTGPSAGYAGAANTPWYRN
jgi:hypothetical protein